jgi:hypothetical protein
MLWSVLHWRRLHHGGHSGRPLGLCCRQQRRCQHRLPSVLDQGRSAVTTTTTTNPGWARWGTKTTTPIDSLVARAKQLPPNWRRSASAAAVTAANAARCRRRSSSQAAACYEIRVLWYLHRVLIYQSHIVSL